MALVDAVLLFDGVFLLRPELIDQWDLRIVVSAAFEERPGRAQARDRVHNDEPQRPTWEARTL
jgi:uridine kinase